MGIFFGDEILGARILVSVAGEFTIVWEHIGTDWKREFDTAHAELESRYECLQFQVLRPYTTTHEHGENVDSMWLFTDKVP
jgi:hypothetical protein